MFIHDVHGLAEKRVTVAKLLAGGCHGFLGVGTAKMSQGQGGSLEMLNSQAVDTVFRDIPGKVLELLVESFFNTNPQAVEGVHLDAL